MPNHVKSILSLEGDPKRIQVMLEAIQSDEIGIGSVDFNKIIPMPKSLDIEAGSRTDRGLKTYRTFIEVYTFGRSTENARKAMANIPVESEECFLSQRADIKRDEWELGKAAWHNIRQYGAPTWYEWSIRHWGTKWNAYGYGKAERRYYEGNSLNFQTAWNAPHPILRKLSELYPDVKIEHKWADKDIGQNCGRHCYQGGDRTEEYYPESETEAVVFACKVWEYEPADMGLCLNAAGTKYIHIELEEYQRIELLGMPALFANDRLTDADVPQGLYCYHLRHGGEGGRFCSLEPKVVVNHGGSVLMKEPIDFGEQGYLPLTESTEPNFLGKSQTLADFLHNDSPQESEVMKLC